MAAAMAFLATVALPIGAILGVYARPGRKLVAAVLAFGSGALIQALAVDLAFEGVERLIHGRVAPLAAWSYVAVGFLTGGGVFYLANRALEDHGGHLRKQSTFAAYVARERHHFHEILHRLHVDRLPHLIRHGTDHARAVEHAAVAPAAAERHGSSAPMAIFLGALLDGIPESVVIGASFVSLATFHPSFVIAVFLNNLPEAMSSANGMLQCGFARARIFTLWGGLVVASMAAAALGNVFLAGASPTLLVFVNALAGGGILAMLASTMMPEAFEEGGPSVGLSTIAGFLAAFLFSALKLG